MFNNAFNLLNLIHFSSEHISNEMISHHANQNENNKQEWTTYSVSNGWIDFFLLVEISHIND
jgi:hypothetical protein